jgi:hypothetical protein
MRRLADAGEPQSATAAAARPRLAPQLRHYGELLHRGQVSSPEGVDPEQWRAQIRAQARRDWR